MINRVVTPLKNRSFFIFGARGTGKSTFLREYFKTENVLWIDLLQSQMEDNYQRRPQMLSEQLTDNPSPPKWIVIDEVQKIPKLLDQVHLLIESKKFLFAMTGSSARKLKQGSANLLAGRAIVNHMFPLTHVELGEQFDLGQALEFGTLPEIIQIPSHEEKHEFLRSYALTYLKEEIWAEHIIRHLEPFRRFLEIAAQCNGEVLNFSNIAKDVGSTTKTIQSYFSILEDTLLGIMLEPHHKSIRKQQRQSPKFYFFDTGVKRALDRTLTTPLLPNTYAFGKAFEHLMIAEAFRLNSYLRKDYRFSYLRTKDGAEIDLLVERPGLPIVLVEIKSTESVDERDTRTLEHFAPDFKRPLLLCLSRDPIPKKIGSVHCLPWQMGFVEMGLG